MSERFTAGSAGLNRARIASFSRPGSLRRGRGGCQAPEVLIVLGYREKGNPGRIHIVIEDFSHHLLTTVAGGRKIDLDRRVCAEHAPGPESDPPLTALNVPRMKNIETTKKPASRRGGFAVR